MADNIMADNIYDGWVIENHDKRWHAVRFGGDLYADTKAKLKALIDEKERPTVWPKLGQETMTIEGTRVTLCTIQHAPDQVAFAQVVHIMYAHDDVRSVSPKFPYFTEREAIRFATDAIKTHREKEEAARRAAKPVPGTVGAAVHRLIEEATSVYDTHGDEFDLEDLKEAIDWVENFLVDSVVIVRVNRPRQGEPDGHVP